MRLIRIRLQNFWSYLDETVELDNQGLCLIKGANGAGKSSVVKAILFVLFGTGTDNVVNNTVGQDTCVTLIGTKGKDNFRVQRYRKHKKHKNNLYLFINDVGVEAATTTDMQSKLEQYIGCDARSFLNIASFSSDMLMFASATDAERKAIFEKILQDLEIYNEYYQQAKEDLEEAKNHRAMYERNLEIDTRELELVKKFLEDETARVEEAEKVREEEIRKLKYVIYDLEKRQLERDELQKRIDRLRNAEGVLGHFFEGMTDYSKEWANNRGEIEMWEQYFSSLDERICSYCHQDISDEHRCKEQVRIGKEIDRMEKLDDELSKKCEIYEKVQDKLWKLGNTVERLTYKLSKYDEVDDQMQTHKEKMEDLERGVDRQAIKKWKSKVKNLSSNIVTYNRIIKDMDNLATYMEEVIKGFSKTGIPNVIIARALFLLEERANGYLDILTNGKLRVSFSGFKFTKKGGVRNKIGIDVVSESGVSSYDSYSGGERQRLNVAILLALRDVAEYSKGIKLNCLFLDEVLDLSLDEEGIEEVLGLLQTKKGAVDSIFVISPKASMLYNTAIEFDEVFTVTKQGGVSSYGKS